MDTNAPVHHKHPVNIEPKERIASVIAGALILANAVKHHKITLARITAGGYLLYRGFTGYCKAYELAGKEHLPDPVKNINIRTSFIVNNHRYHIYNAWRELQNLPLFMEHLESVTVIDEKRSLWKAKVPGGLGNISWEAEIVNDEPGLMLGWSSLPGADIENAGKITFKDAGDYRTEIEVMISYRVPFGIVGNALSRLFTPAFEKMIEKDIYRFKEYIESINTHHTTD